MELLQRHSGELQATFMMQARLADVEQQETLARMALVEEQCASAMVRGAALPSVTGRLAEAQSAAQVSQRQIKALEEALEEKEVALDQMGRELEATQDAQTASDAEVQQRQLTRSEGERRATIVAEQRASWGTLQEIERSTWVAVAQRAVDHLQQAEMVGRQIIAEEQANSLDLGSVLLQLQALVMHREEALALAKVETVHALELAAASDREQPSASTQETEHAVEDPVLLLVSQEAEQRLILGQTEQYDATIPLFTAFFCTF